MSSDSRKVVVHLRATGDAPILKQTKFKGEVRIRNFCIRLSKNTERHPTMQNFLKIAGSDKFIRVVDFLRRQLHRETLFVYVNSAFSPNPDQLIIDLYNNFGIDGKLMVNYACSMAWG